MNTILHLNSSIFGEGGQSSRLASQFVAHFAGARVIQRDLSKNPLPHLDAERFGAFLSKPDARTPEQQQVLDESDALIAELFAARGGLYQGTPRDTQTAYVRDFLAFLGITDVQFVYAEGLAIGEAQRQAAIAGAQRALRELAQPERIAA